MLACVYVRAHRRRSTQRNATRRGRQVRLVDWNAKQIEVINSLPLLTSKPVVYVITRELCRLCSKRSEHSREPMRSVLINMTLGDYAAKKSKWLGKIKTFVDAHGGCPIVRCCETKANQRTNECHMHSLTHSLSRSQVPFCGQF